MKRIFVLVMSLLLLCGCAKEEEKKVMPSLTERTFTDMDMASYKKIWYDEGDEFSGTLNQAFERYIPTEVTSGHEFVFEVAGSQPDEVKVIEYLVRDTNYVLHSDLVLKSNEIESELKDGVLSFEISNDNMSEKRLENRAVSINFKWVKDDEVTEEVEFDFLLEVVDESITEREMKPAEELNIFGGVEMTIEDEFSTGSTIDTTIENNTDNTLITSVWYRIDKMIDDEWYIMNYKPSSASILWDGPDYAVNKNGGKIIIREDIEELYGKLEAGRYRIIKKFYFEGLESLEYETAAEFDVPELIIN